MKKKTTAAVLLCAVILLSSCDSRASYDNFLKRQELPTEITEYVHNQETEQQLNEEAQKPETQEPTPTEEKYESATMPEAIPNLSACVAVVSEGYESESLFKGQYLVTEQQLSDWTKLLEEQGFAEDGVYTNGKDKITVTKISQSEQSSSDYRIAVTIELYSYKPAWANVYPDYSGTGKAHFEADGESEQSAFLVIENETKESFSAYLKTLESNGFVNIGYGIYSKAIQTVRYEIETDGAWVDNTTVKIKLLYYSEA